MDFASLLSAVLMGIVEGVTEFLPISSTGHLILLGEAIGFQGPPGKTFEISIQFGAILAVIWLFRATLIRIAFGMWRRGSAEYYYAINILLAFLPAMVLGATLYGYITSLLYTPLVVALALIAGGIAIIVIEKLRAAPTIHTVPEIGPVAALLIGFGRRWPWCRAPAAPAPPSSARCWWGWNGARRRSSASCWPSPPC
ncbi:undecaprenyl-diphosphate phosphatase [Teichococcus aestuarii]|uniref:undecaprenyl-diphosphate phosphatase n=1 Tax=Teichococcus aestuarii TaxID=568898 RepID=UPI00360A3AAA